MNESLCRQAGTGSVPSGELHEKIFRELILQAIADQNNETDIWNLNKTG